MGWWGGEGGGGEVVVVRQSLPGWEGRRMSGRETVGSCVQSG